MKSAYLAGTAACVALFAASGACAQGWDSWMPSGSWYVGGEGGYHFPNDFRAHTDQLATDGHPYHWNFNSRDDDWMAVGKIGYHFDSGWRVEAEYAFRNGQINSVEGDGGRAQPTGLCAQGRLRSPASPACGSANGNLNVQSEMLNIIYEVPWHPSMWGFAVVPFIGGGAGAAQLQTHVDGQLSAVPAGFAPIENAHFDDDKTAFAYQGLAGFSWKYGPHWSVDLTGRYFAATRGLAPARTFDASGGGSAAVVPLGTFKGEYQDQSVTIGLRYAFASLRRLRRRLPRRRRHPRRRLHPRRLRRRHPRRRSRPRTSWSISPSISTC
ncbi:MAG TPA: outer membrane beta-barrel protein [Caulobacteraceae bacterium]|nr:outer membrane beta-barrel protein [Caulobacteraceae bacterium]